VSTKAQQLIDKDEERRLDGALSEDKISRAQDRVDMSRAQQRKAQVSLTGSDKG
jgi:hypothetical protein